MVPATVLQQECTPRVHKGASRHWVTTRFRQPQRAPQAENRGASYHNELLQTMAGVDQRQGHADGLQYASVNHSVHHKLKTEARVTTMSCCKRWLVLTNDKGMLMGYERDSSGHVMSKCINTSAAPAFQRFADGDCHPKFALMMNACALSGVGLNA
jgi:hypothetical protein